MCVVEEVLDEPVVAYPCVAEEVMLVWVWEGDPVVVLYPCVDVEVPVELPPPDLAPVELVVVPMSVPEVEPLPCVVVEEPVEPEAPPVFVLWTLMAV